MYRLKWRIYLLMTLTITIATCSDDVVDSDVDFQNEPPVAVVLDDSAVASYTTLQLKWSRSPDEDFLQYLVYHSFSLGVTVSDSLYATISNRGDTTYSVSGLRHNTTHYFRVFVEDTLNVSSGSNEISVRTLKFDYQVPEGFPDDFPVQYDGLTDAVLEGWGGGDGEVLWTPVVFIHGNAHSANNWRDLAAVFIDSGYIPQELWAMSYLDWNGGDSTNSNIANMIEVENFISDVLDYTGAERVDVISHSLGVTLGRAWLKTYDRYESVRRFIGIAGANHGVGFCVGDTITILCREIGHPQSDFLEWLNNPDETPRDDIVDYMTVYDGTEVDFFYLANQVMNDGSVADLRLSPLLDGAYNLQNAGINHFLLTTDDASVREMLIFLQNKTEEG